MNKQRLNRGYLLVELLAVITLVAMVFAAVLPGLAPKSDAIEREELIDRLRSFDELARIASIREGPLLLRADPKSGSLFLQGVGSEAVVRRMNISGAEVALLSVETGRPIRGLAIDRLGRADQYVIFVEPRVGEPVQVAFSMYGHAIDGPSQ